MTSFYAKPKIASHQTPRKIVFLAYPGVKLLDLVGPLQVFSDAVSDLESEQPAYEVKVVSINGGPVETDTPVPISTIGIDDVVAEPINTLIVPGGRGSDGASRDGVLIDRLNALCGQSERIASVCSGAFILAAAGLLDNRRAVTHWQSCAYLAAKYPKIRVETDPIFINDGDIWTSAGVTAGIDLSLAMVAEDLGRPLALALARPSRCLYGEAWWSVPVQRYAPDAEQCIPRAV